MGKLKNMNKNNTLEENKENPFDSLKNENFPNLSGIFNSPQKDLNNWKKRNRRY